MVEHLKLSVDAMGGDDAPHMVIEGIDLMGSMPNSVNSYNLEMQVTGNPQLGGLPIPISWS